MKISSHGRYCDDERSSRVPQVNGINHMQPERITSLSSGSDFVYLPGLTLGASLQIKIEGLGTDQTCLIGMAPGEFFIIRTPLLPSIGSKLFEKNHIIVRYIFSGRVYGFRCTLIELIKKPHRLSILSYPDTIEYINLRKHERIPCFLNAEVTVKNRCFQGIISDISIGGCSFEVDKTENEEFPHCGVNEAMLIGIRFRKEGEETVFNAAVRTFRVESQGMMIGLSFAKSGVQEKDAKSEKDLQDCILALMNN